MFQSYNNTPGRWRSAARSVMRANSKITADQFIYTEGFQNNPTNANGFSRYVDFAKANNAGGIGAFHINEDYLYSGYNNVKNAIKALNPPMDK